MKYAAPEQSPAEVKEPLTLALQPWQMKSCGLSGVTRPYTYIATS